MGTRWDAQFFEEKFTEDDPWSTDADLRPRIRFSAMREMTRVIGPKSVLDAGCGMGQYLSVVQTGLPGLRLCGFDWSENAIRRARTRLTDDIELFRRDVLDYFKAPVTRRFDLIVFGHVLFNLTEDGLAQLAGVLRLHGRDPAHVLVAEEFGRHAGVQRALEAHGWRLAREFHLVEPGVWTSVLQHFMHTEGGARQ